MILTSYIYHHVTLTVGHPRDARRVAVPVFGPASMVRPTTLEALLRDSKVDPQQRTLSFGLAVTGAAPPPPAAAAQEVLATPGAVGGAGVTGSGREVWEAS